MLLVSVTLTRQAEGVYNQRLQNLAVTLDKVTSTTISFHKNRHFYLLSFTVFCVCKCGKMFFQRKVVSD